MTSVILINTTFHHQVLSKLRTLHHFQACIVIILEQLGAVAIRYRRLRWLIMRGGRDKPTIIRHTQREIRRKILVEGAFGVNLLCGVLELRVGSYPFRGEERLITVTERIPVDIRFGVVEMGIGRVGIVGGLEGVGGPGGLVDTGPSGGSVEVAGLLSGFRLERTLNQHIDKVRVVGL